MALGQAASGGNGAGAHQATRGTPHAPPHVTPARPYCRFFFGMRHDAALPDGSEANTARERQRLRCRAAAV